VRFKTRSANEGWIFQKSTFLALFFPKFSGISGIFRIFGDFRGNFPPKNVRFSRKFFPADFPEIGCIFASSRKKPEKNRTFFPGISGGFPGDGPRHFRGNFLRKNAEFDQFYTDLHYVYTAAQSVFYENNEIFRKGVRTFYNFENSRKKISPKFRKFPPTFSKFPDFPEIPGFSGISIFFQHFLRFCINVYHHILKLIHPIRNQLLKMARNHLFHYRYVCTRILGTVCSP